VGVRWGGCEWRGAGLRLRNALAAEVLGGELTTELSHLRTITFGEDPGLMWIVHGDKGGYGVLEHWQRLCTGNERRCNTNPIVRRSRQPSWSAHPRQAAPAHLLNGQIEKNQHRQHGEGNGIVRPISRQPIRKEDNARGDRQ